MLAGLRCLNKSRWRGLSSLPEWVGWITPSEWREPEWPARRAEPGWIKTVMNNFIYLQLYLSPPACLRLSPRVSLNVSGVNFAPASRHKGARVFQAGTASR